MEETELMMAGGNDERSLAVDASPSDIREKSRGVPKRPSLPMCPAATSHFTGRSTALEKLRSVFFDSTKEAGDASFETRSAALVCAVTGMEGCGKSQLCFRFVETEVLQWQSLSSTRNVFFIDATTKNSIEASLIAISKAKGAGDSVEAAVRYMASTSESEESFIMVDNLDRSNFSLHDHLPMGSPNARVLVSTRFSAGRLELGCDPASCVEVPSLGPDEAQALLASLAMLAESAVRDHESDNADLVKELHFHPFAISQAGSFISTTRCLVRDYTTDFRSKYSELTTRNFKSDSDAEVSDGGEHIRATVYLSYEEIDVSYPRASHLLGLFALLDQDGLGEDILEHAFQRMKTYTPTFPSSTFQDSDLASVRDLIGSFSDGEAWSSALFKKAVTALCESSLLRRDNDGRYFIPRTIRQSLSPYLNNDDSEITSRPHKATRTQAFFLISAAITQTWSDQLSLMQLLPHVLHLLPHIDDPLEITSQLHPDCCFAFARPLVMGGFLARAEIYYRASVDIYRQQDPESYDSLTAQREHAITLQKLGKLIEAKDILLQLRDVCQRRPEKLDESKDLLTDVLSALSTVLGRLADNDAAAEMKEEVVRRRTERHESDDRSTLQARATLAVTWYHLGRKNQALKEQEDVYRASLRLFGRDDLDTINARKLYAGTLSRQCQYKAAVLLHRQVVASRKRLLGRDHPDTIEAMAELANTLARVSSRFHGEAKILQGVVVESVRVRFGEEHIKTLRAEDGLAVILGRLSTREDKEEGLGILARNVMKYERQLGEEHPEVLAARVKLAQALERFNETHGDEAREQWKIVLERSRSVAENGLPEPMYNKENMAKALHGLGRVKEEAKVLEEVVEERKRQLGDHDHRTIGVVRRLAEVLRGLKEGVKADEYGEMANVMNEGRWGSNHRLTKNSREWLERTTTSSGVPVADKSWRVRQPSSGPPFKPRGASASSACWRRQSLD